MTPPQLLLSEGTYLYLLGLVVIATHPTRFWLGLALALVSLLIGAINKAIPGAAGTSPRQFAHQSTGD